MRKSNWIIAAVLAGASVLFLWLWHVLQFSGVDSPLDIVVAVVWWAAIAGACIAIHLAERKRRERVRTIFVGPGLIYNSETGIVRLAENASLVEALQQVLAGLTYGFDVAAPPANSRVRFQLIVRSSAFGNGGGTWEGEVVEVAHPDQPIPFQSRSELAAIVGEKVA